MNAVDRQVYGWPNQISLPLGSDGFFATLWVKDHVQERMNHIVTKHGSIDPIHGNRHEFVLKINYHRQTVQVKWSYFLEDVRTPDIESAPKRKSQLMFSVDVHEDGKFIPRPTLNNSSAIRNLILPILNDPKFDIETSEGKTLH